MNPELELWLAIGMIVAGAILIWVVVRL